MPKFTKVVAENVVFKTLIENDSAQIIPVNGTTALLKHSNKQIYSLPPGVTLSVDLLWQNVGVIYRPVSQEIIIERGVDDIYEEELAVNDTYMPVDKWSEIMELYTELKIQALTSIGSPFSTLVSGLCLTAVSAFLLHSGYQFTEIAVAAGVIGILATVFAGIIPLVSRLRVFTDGKIFDSRGNYINIKTGKTSLNGGIYIPVGVN